MPTVSARPRARPTARALGVYPVAAMTSRTRIAVAASTSPLLLSTRDTVVLLTRARLATSAIVTRMPIRIRSRDEGGGGSRNDGGARRGSDLGSEDVDAALG